ncbi:DUF1844 domain-containing protein [bacterium]|nr:DUF1844 domain-containing protein [bacterium]RQV92067.1 MAG: DUF1844 domain-containing protein [bacterium]
MSENNQKSEALFMQLVLTFQMAAWQQMGKIKNPLTDKVERDLYQAQYSIDILEMLRSKTAGNLNDNEKQFLNKILSELQLNYIDEMSKEKKEREQKKETVKEEQGAEVKEEEKETAVKEKDEKNQEEKPKKSQKTGGEKSRRKSSKK